MKKQLQGLLDECCIKMCYRVLAIFVILLSRTRHRLNIQTWPKTSHATEEKGIRSWDEEQEASVIRQSLPVVHLVGLFAGSRRRRTNTQEPERCTNTISNELQDTHLIFETLAYVGTLRRYLPPPKWH